VRLKENILALGGLATVLLLPATNSKRMLPPDRPSPHPNSGVLDRRVWLRRKKISERFRSLNVLGQEAMDVAALCPAWSRPVRCRVPVGVTAGVMFEPWIGPIDDAPAALKLPIASSSIAVLH
jgi:hypothetical protein